MILASHAQFQNITERAAGLYLVAWQAEYFEEPSINNLQPVLCVDQAKALRHVVECDIEALVRLPEIGLLGFRQTNVAAYDDETLVTRRTVTDSEPASVRQQHFASRVRVALAPQEQPACAH